MKKIIIIGAGFAGLSAAAQLSKSRLDLEVTVIDRKKTSDFLPTLPDCIGRGINPDYLSYEIEKAAKKYDFKFINSEVLSLDLRSKTVSTANFNSNYDFLIIASGSETNFYGNDNIGQFAYKIDDVRDTRRIVAAVKENKFHNYIIAGAGYTGIEVATNLIRYLNDVRKNAKIIIIERAASILGPLPQWMKDYVSRNLKRMGIEVFVNSSIEKIEADMVYASGSRVFENSMVIWAAGVKTGAFIQSLNLEKNPQGRIKVDEYLRASDSCFVIGDAAYFSSQGAFLRMAVQFAIAQGVIAAENVLRSIKGDMLKSYQPLDLGLIIPMANNKSCGNVFGKDLKGELPTFFHFVMCIYRSRGLKNKLGLIKDLVTRKKEVRYG